LVDLRPDIDPLEVLDVAMRTQPQHELRLESDDDPLVDLFVEHLDPPSPFAEVVRRAFAPQISRDDFDLIAQQQSPSAPEAVDRVRSVQDEWNRALDAFGRRYALWQ